MNSSSFPRYRDHYLPALTPRRIAALPDRDWAPVILAVGAIEQHGPHLPVAVDSYLAQVWCEELLKYLPPGAACYFAPPITIGKSNEHTGFPGTLTISKDTLRAQLWAIARQVEAWGFRQLIILNTHGGNMAVLAYTLREINAALKLRAGTIATKHEFKVSPQEGMYGYHANEVETALLLATAPQLVKTGAVADFLGRIEDNHVVRPERAPVTYAWVSQDISRTGIMGDASAGTAENGHKWVAIGAEGCAQAIAVACEQGKTATMPR